MADGVTVGDEIPKNCAITSPADLGRHEGSSIKFESVVRREPALGAGGRRLVSVQVSVGCGHRWTSRQGCTGHFAVRHR